MTRQMTVSACGLVVLMVVSSLHAAPQGAPPAMVRVDAARIERVQEQRMVTGELRAVQRSRVAGEEPGIVLSAKVQQGQAVKRGEPLALLDARRLEIELLEVEADRQVALADAAEREADLEWRVRDLENYQTLAQSGAGKAKELYDAEMAVRVARLKLESARRSVDAIASRSQLLQNRIDDTRILAPFDGIIISKLVEEGEWLAAGSAVVEMISTATVDVWLDVPQQFAQAVLARTPTVSILLEATGERMETSSVRAIPQVDQRARTFSLIARLDNAHGQFAPGMSVSAYVPTGELADRLTISRDAVMRNPTGAFVYVARQSAPDAPPAAMPADVQVLFGSGDRFVVNAPSIKPGDLLVVEGNERLFPTAPIIPQPTTQPPAQP